MGRATTSNTNEGNPRNLRLFGQESNGGVWSISQMNMILHGVLDGDIRNGDTIGDPQHKDGGELMRFDRVITNPPLILNWFAAKKQYNAGIVEGLNANVKLGFRKAYGFRTFKVVEVALYHQLGDLPEPPIAHRFC